MAYEKKPWNQYKIGEIINIRNNRYEVEYKCIDKTYDKFSGELKETEYVLFLKALDTMENRYGVIDEKTNVVKFSKVNFFYDLTSCYVSWNDIDLNKVKNGNVKVRKFKSN